MRVQQQVGEPAARGRRRAAWQGPLGAVVAVATLVVAEHEAAACECVVHEPLVRPSAQDAVVAANTKLWLEGPGVDGSSCGPLLDAASQPVATTRTELWDRGARSVRAIVLTPAAELTVGASYGLACDFYGTEIATTFTVTDPADQQAPAVPQAVIGDVEHEGSSGSSCGEADHAPVALQHDGGIVVVDIAGESALDPSGPSGNVNDVYAGDGFIVGNQICGRHSNWDIEEDGDATDVRFGSFDLAGNFSGWSGPQEVSAGCGCRLAPVAGGVRPVAALALLALFGLSRRRRTAR